MSKFKLKKKKRKAREDYRPATGRYAVELSKQLTRMTSLPAVPGQQLPPQLPPPKFELGVPIIVPAEIHDSRLAYICGIEPGPNARKSCATWTYAIRFPDDDSSRFPGGEAWAATEEEVMGWQK